MIELYLRHFYYCDFAMGNTNQTFCSDIFASIFFAIGMVFGDMVDTNIAPQPMVKANCSPTNTPVTYY